MTMTEDETSNAHPARSPDTKAALNYLIASGATAISIVDVKGGCAFRVGTKIDPRAIAIYWINESFARPVIKLARQHAGKSPHGGDATEALHRAAVEMQATSTPHDVALKRAGDAAKRLDAFIEGLSARGAMREFTKKYRQQRLAAVARGEGFMSFKVAEERLRQALIPMLVSGQTVGVQSLFSAIFK